MEKCRAYAPILALHALDINRLMHSSSLIEASWKSEIEAYIHEVHLWALGNLQAPMIHHGIMCDYAILRWLPSVLGGYPYAPS